MITLRQIQQLNDDRSVRWHADATRQWSVLEWAGAMCGEAGEAANVAKKLLRIELGTPGNAAAEHPVIEKEALRQQLAGEIGGIILYAALLATHAGIDLESAVVQTFNEKSVGLGFPERL